MLNVSLELADVQASRHWAQTMLLRHKVTKVIQQRLKADIQLRRHHFEQVNQAARCIQRHARHWLESRTSHTQLIAEARLLFKLNLEDCQQFVSHLAFSDSTLTQAAATAIQNAYRRRRWHKKIQAFRICFANVQKINRRMAKDQLRRYSRVLVNRLRVFEIKQEMERIARLAEIKINLIKLTIKKHWKRLRCSAKKMIYRFKQYKRELRGEEEVKNQVFLPGQLKSSVADLTKKIQYGYISYNVKHLKLQGINPLFSKNHPPTRFGLKRLSNKESTVKIRWASSRRSLQTAAQTSRRSLGSLFVEDPSSRHKL